MRGPCDPFAPASAHFASRTLCRTTWNFVRTQAVPLSYDRGHAHFFPLALPFPCVQYIPPYLGLGSEEDSLATCFSIVPKPFKKGPPHSPRLRLLAVADAVALRAYY